MKSTSFLLLLVFSLITVACKEKDQSKQTAYAAQAAAYQECRLVPACSNACMAQYPQPAPGSSAVDQTLERNNCLHKQYSGKAVADTEIGELLDNGLTAWSNYPDMTKDQNQSLRSEFEQKVSEGVYSICNADGECSNFIGGGDRQPASL